MDWYYDHHIIGITWKWIIHWHPIWNHRLIHSYFTQGLKQTESIIQMEWMWTSCGHSSSGLLLGGETKKSVSFSLTGLTFVMNSHTGADVSVIVLFVDLCFSAEPTVNRIRWLTLSQGIGGKILSICCDCSWSGLCSFKYQELYRVQHYTFKVFIPFANSCNKTAIRKTISSLSINCETVNPFFSSLEWVLFFFASPLRYAHRGAKRFPVPRRREKLQPLSRRGQSLQPQRKLQEATLRLHRYLQQGGPQQGWNLQQEALPQSAEAVPGPRAPWVQPPAALLPLPECGLRRATQADNRAWLLL